jgi:DNA end-binding protein Ku
MATDGRAYWKGVLRLSLVSIPVEIFNAVDSSTEIKFNQIHKPSGKRIHYTKTVEGIGPVEPSEIVKGFALDDDQYVYLEPDELESIKLESKKTLDLTQFVDVKDIDPRFFDRPYYLVPQDDTAAEGYMVIREALTKMNKLGVGQVTAAGREYLVAVGPVDRGLVMEIMRYADELKAPNTYFHDLPDTKVDPDMVSLATEIIKRKSGPFKPEEFTDHYATAVRELVKEKSKGKRIVTVPDDEPATGGTVINLMDALRRSLKGADKSADVKAKPIKKKAKAG